MLTAKMRSLRTSGKRRAARWRALASETETKWPLVGQVLLSDAAFDDLLELKRREERSDMEGGKCCCSSWGSEGDKGSPKRVSGRTIPRYLVSADSKSPTRLDTKPQELTGV